VRLSISFAHCKIDFLEQGLPFFLLSVAMRQRGHRQSPGYLSLGYYGTIRMCYLIVLFISFMSNVSSYSERAQALLPPNPKAFIVDDSVPTRRIFRTILQELGFTVSEAVNGRLALEKLESELEGTTIIFSDISMPEMDGFEFCFKLMQKPWYNGTPFILVSTESDAKNVIKGLKFGADDFLPKPFDKEIVAQVLMRIFQ